jgi:YidC/Oxa1 family membrane protein insertase
VTFAGNNMQKEMSDFQPKMAEIQERYKDDPKKMSEETMKLFKNQGM